MKRKFIRTVVTTALAIGAFLIIEAAGKSCASTKTATAASTAGTPEKAITGTEATSNTGTASPDGCHESTADIGKPTSERHLCGGFTPQRELTTEDIELFHKVMGGRTSLSAGDSDTLTPLSVATQVVAGLNYKFLCESKGGTRVFVTIYQPLEGDPVLLYIE